MEHELDLFENAIDSLNESLRKFAAGRNGEARELKFAILHFAHFIELLLKHYVCRSHPLLIYRNPFAQNVERGPTIGLWDAIWFLKNEGKPLDPDLSRDLEWLKRLRNSIEHYRVSINVTETRRNLARLIRAAEGLARDLLRIELVAHIDSDCKGLFTGLLDEWATAIADAEAQARDESEDGKTYMCYECGFLDTGARSGDEVTCVLCSTKYQLAQCSQCEMELATALMTVWNGDESSGVAWICEFCEEQVLGRAD